MQKYLQMMILKKHKFVMSIVLNVIAIKPILQKFKLEVWMNQVLNFICVVNVNINGEMIIDHLK